ncbi:MAG: S-adenosylmethionine:tRNA ribosyltransferase-isomerase [Ignavibacteriae bacterium]|nr:S-adenosylmethionine:tRNA ribosyltransferase-isomerase [Ignavibacteriota bacterium]
MIETNYIPKINLADFNYELPHNKIAEYPLEERSSSKLLYAEIKNKNISHHKFSEIPGLIPFESLLVFNSTKVIPARIFLRKPTGGLIELLLIEPVKNNSTIPYNKGENTINPQIALNFKKEGYWLCIVGGKRVREGMLLTTDIEKEIELRAEIISRNETEAIVKFSWLPENLTFSEVLIRIGNVPLPPYINRRVTLEDKKWYQTVYAKTDGSVAAPTAGFHFTNDVINKLKEKNINIENIVLHVGPGTFKPIDVDNIQDHKMHSESICIPKKTIDNLCIYLSNNANPKIIATGTTTLRTLESLYWIGCKLIKNEMGSEDILTLNQWDCYEITKNNILPACSNSFAAIQKFMDARKMNELNARTSLFIIPGYEFKIVNGIITNYHLPKSTLILLIAAFTGKEFWELIYKSALNNNYRFLSYGDSSLITNF